MAKRTFGRSLTAWLLGWLFNLAGMLIVWLLKMVLRVTWWSVRQAVGHPRTSLGLGALGGVVALLGWQPVAWIIGIGMLAASTWKAAHRQTFDRLLGDWVAAWHRRWWLCRRAWERVTTRCGLAVETADERHVPVLRRIEHGRYWDRLSVEMQDGQELADWQAATGKLRTAFRAQRATVREVEPAGVELALMRRDPFRSEFIPAVPMPASTADIDFTALPVGLTEWCTPWTVSVTGAHTAVCGGSGSGKASIVWNLLRSMAPAIADGTVKLHFVDPKRQELAQGRALVATHVPVTQELDGRGYVDVVGDETPSYVTGPKDTAAMLRGLRVQMERDAEAAGLAGERDHEPSPDRPLHLIVIDELAPLLAYWSRTVRDWVGGDLGLLLTQGRSVGYVVVGSIQEPTKDVFTVRDLFGRRIGLRLPTESHTDAALAEHAADRGALCHQIPEDLPGTAYQLLMGESSASRSRAGHVRAEDIAALVEYVAQLRLVAEVRAADAAPADEVTA